MPASVLFGYLYKDFGALVAFSSGAGLAPVVAIAAGREAAGRHDGIAVALL